MKQKLLSVFLSALVGLCIVSCKEDTVALDEPTIAGFAPTDGVAGASITISGTNFSTTPADNSVGFNGIKAIVTASTTSSITVTVPVGAISGAISVFTNVGKAAISATPFRVDKLYKATLSGAQEVPPATTPATGTATLLLNTDTKIFVLDVTYSGLTTAPSNGHIHKAAAGIAGGVVFPFSSFVSPIRYTSPAITPAQEADLDGALNYVNIHSTTYPGGEIRGQLLKP